MDGNSQKNRKKVSICILTYNRCELLSILLDDLKKIRYQPLEILVVDNRSTDGTNQYIKQHHPDVVYCRMPENIGVAARNFGLRNASGEYIITIDDDIIGLDDQGIDYLNRYFSNHAGVAAVNFRVLLPNSNQVTNWVHHCRDDLYADSVFKTYEITEGAVAFRRTAIDKSGYYVDYFFISHEGPDLAFRLINLGYDIIYSPQVVVFHHHSQIARKTWRRYYYDTRNLIWLSMRNLPFGYGFVFTSRGIAAQFVYSLRDGFLTYYARALIDAFKSYRKIIAHRKPLNPTAVRKLRKIDKRRPNLFYMIRKRLFQRGIRI